MVSLRTNKLTKKLESSDTYLVRNIDMEVQQGEFVAICGPSGSGKSSLLYLLGLLDTPTSGKLFINDIDVYALEDREKAKFRLEHIGFVFQFHFLLPEFTLLENVMLPMMRRGVLHKEDMKKRATELLTRLGLGEEIKKLPKQISGGQSQRVAIARALANEPRIVLADEPTGNLDSRSSENVQNILREVSRITQSSVIAVTHDRDFAGKADRVINVVDGQIQS